MRRLKEANFLLKYNWIGINKVKRAIEPKQAGPSVGQSRQTDTRVCIGPSQTNGSMMKT